MQNDARAGGVDAMGRLVKKSEARGDIAGKQGTLFGFLTSSRKPLVDVNDKVAPSARGDGDEKNPATDAGDVPSSFARVVARAPPLARDDDRREDDPAEDDASARLAMRPPPRMADALVKMERAIEGWGRLFASHRRARHRDDADALAASNAARVASSVSSLSSASYEHRVAAVASARWQRAGARSCIAHRCLRARESHPSSTRPRASGLSLGRETDARAPGGGAGGKRALEMTAHALMFDAVRELGVCHLPRDPRETDAAQTSSAGDPVASCAYSPNGGTHLAVATARGLLCVQRADTVRVSDGELYEPSFARRGLGSGGIGRAGSSLSSIAWGGGSGGVAAVSGDSNAVEVFDVCVGVTKRTFSSANQMGSGSVGDATGLLDVCFVGDGGDKVLASGRRGRAFLWDERSSGGRPRAELACGGSDHRSQIHVVRASADGHTVFAGTEGGFVHVWDLRAGAKAKAAAFSLATQQKVSYPLLKSIDIASLLNDVPMLRDGPRGKVTRSAVYWCEQDPLDPRRLGFHLRSGVSGVIDLAAVGGARVSHAHCPPSPWTIAEDGATVVASEMYDANALRHRRTAAWVVNASSGAGCAALAVGAAGTRGLKFLDVSPSPTARHWVHGVTAEDVDADESAEAARMEREMFSEMEEKKLAGGGNAMDAELAMDAGRRRRRDGRGRWWRDDPIELSGPAFAVAAHPNELGTIAAGSWGSMCLLGHR